LDTQQTENDIGLAGNSSVADQPSTLQVLKNAPFMILFAAQFTQNIGAAVSWLALTFFIVKLTDSPTLMGLLSITFWLPYVLFTPFAGVLVDRYDQRKIMLYSNLISLFATLGFIVIYVLRNALIIITITTELLPSGFGGNVLVTYIDTNYLHLLWPLYLLTFINSTAASIFFPTRNSYTRLIVRKKNLLIANSIGSTVFQVATIVGYVIAGLLAARNYLHSFIFDACTFAFSSTMIIVILYIGKKPPDVIRPKEDTIREQMKGVSDDLKIGYRTIRETPKIGYMLILFASAIFAFSAFNVLFIIKLNREMGLDETWYGALQAVMGISGVITSLILMYIGKMKRKIMVLNFAILACNIILYLFALSENPWVIGVILFMFGIALVFINIPATTLIQEQIPFEKQGRVFGTQQLFQGIARLIGMGIVALIAETVATKWIILAASGCLSIMMIFGFIFSWKKNLMTEDVAIDDKIDLYQEATDQPIITESLVIDVTHTESTLD
jgi:DHA3 family macrolide efflux protein-like MFS transporter